MRTEEAVQQIKPYLIGDLTPKEVANLEGHIAVDETAQWHHARAYRQLLPVLKQPEVQPSPGVIDGLFATAKAMIEEGKEVQRPAMRLLMNDVWKYRKVAAALLLAAGLSVALVIAGSKDKPSPLGTMAVAAHDGGPARVMQIKTGEKLLVPEGSAAVVTLADGVRLQLTGGSEARLSREVKERDGFGNVTSHTVELLRGDVLVDTVAFSSRSPSVFVTVKAGDDFVVRAEDVVVPGASDSRPLAQQLFAVSYRGPVSKVERRSDRIIDIDMQRQPVAAVLDIAPMFGKQIRYPEALSESFVDVKGRGLDWNGFVRALSAANITVKADGAGGWEWVDDKDTNAGRKLKREIFDVTVLHGHCTVEAGNGTSRLFASGPDRTIAATRGGAWRDASGEIRLPTSPTRGGHLDRELLELFAVAPLPGGAAAPGLAMVFERSSTPLTIAAPMSPVDGGMLVKIDDAQKLIQHGGEYELAGIKGRVVHIGKDSVFLRDAGGAIHKLTSQK